MTIFKTLVFSMALLFLPVLTQASDVDNSIGYYQINDAKMDIKDHVVKWFEEEKRLEIIFTPSILTSEEKSGMLENEDPNRFTLPPFKESPNTDVWKNYPYVKFSIAFASENVSLENVKAVSVKTFGVEGEGGNTFFSIFQSDLNLEVLSFEDGKVKMKFSGDKDGYPDGKYTWEIEVK